MADIDIFDLEPTAISRDLKGKYIMLYGAAKVGKTSFAVKAPRALVCAFEMGTNALSGVNLVPIMKWLDFKKVVKQLRDPRGRTTYDTIVIDTVSIAYNLCEKYICQQNGVTQLREIPWGQGWSLVKNEFQETFRELTMLGYGLIFIAHAKEKATEALDENGEAITAMAPDIPNAAYNIVNALVDIIGYISVEFDKSTGESKRYLYTRQTPTIFAGSRYQYLEPKIEFGYDNLVNAIGDAIEKSVTLDGATAIDARPTERSVTKKSFSEVMNEARAQYNRIDALPDADDKMEKVARIVQAYFGSPEFRLSETKESQQDLLESVVEEMKEL